MGVEQVRDEFMALGNDPAGVVWAEVPDVVPSAPSHRWVVLPTSGDETIIGGMDRGRFAAYGRYAEDATAAQDLTRLVTPPVVAPLPRDASQIDAAARGLVATLDSALGEGDVLQGTAVPEGAVFDHIGDESGHFLYAYATPVGQRSIPPTDLDEPRTGYLLLRALPDTCVASRVQPWFGQPGGGWVVELDRVIAFYCDSGHLLRFEASIS